MSVEEARKSIARDGIWFRRVTGVTAKSQAMSIELLDWSGLRSESCEGEVDSNAAGASKSTARDRIWSRCVTGVTAKSGRKLEVGAKGYNCAKSVEIAALSSFRLWQTGASLTGVIEMCAKFETTF